VVVGLAVLAALTIAIVAIGAGEDEASDTTTTSSTAPTSTTGRVGGSSPDVVVAGQLLPATLGPGWVEVTREAQPTPAEVDPTDPCATLGQPIQRGLVVRASFDHLADDIVEQAAIVAGVIEEGTPVPRLDDPAVTDCLQQGLRPQVAEGSEIVPADQDPVEAPDGAELTGARFEVQLADGTVAGRFELLLLRRDRAVSFALVAVLDAASATPLDDLVAALDAPLASAEGRLN
jgi:hypothetical protein